MSLKVEGDRRATLHTGVFSAAVELPLPRLLDGDYLMPQSTALGPHVEAEQTAHRDQLVIEALTYSQQHPAEPVVVFHHDDPSAFEGRLRQLEDEFHRRLQDISHGLIALHVISPTALPATA